MTFDFYLTILVFLLVLILLFKGIDKLKTLLCKHNYCDYKRDNKYIYHVCSKCNHEIKNEWFYPSDGNNEPKTNKVAMSSHAAPNCNEGSNFDT